MSSADDQFVPCFHEHSCYCWTVAWGQLIIGTVLVIYEMGLTLFGLHSFVHLLQMCCSGGRKGMATVSFSQIVKNFSNQHAENKHRQRKEGGREGRR